MPIWLHTGHQPAVGAGMDYFMLRDRPHPDTETPQRRPSLLASELDSEHRLKPSWNVLLRSHRAECRAGRGNVGDAETGLVEDVKRVDAGFQTQALVNLNVLD